MDLFANNPSLHFWLIHYGSFALFILLALGIIALPVPEETLMILAGILIQTGHLQVPQAIIAAYLGSLFGITTSYLIGRTAGHALLNKLNKWMGGKYSQQFEKAKTLFVRFGKWALVIGYFIPGFRHFMGVFAGMSAFHYREFALFAYSGSLIWVSTYLSVGYFFGQYGLAIYENIVENILTFVGYLVIAALVALGIYFIYKNQEKG